MPPSHQPDHIPIHSAFQTTNIRMIDVDLRAHLAGPPAVPALARDVRVYGAMISRKYCYLLEARRNACRIDLNMLET